MSTWTKIEGRLGAWRETIKQAAVKYRVPPALIAAILTDELRRRDLGDEIQDRLARFLIRAEGRLEQVARRAWEWLAGQTIDMQSFGAAQMNAGTAAELVEKGYLDRPAGWSGDRLDCTLSLVLDPKLPPVLVAARLRQTLDHWQAGGVDLSRRPDILASLYSIGLTSSRGVHPHPEPNERGLQIAADLARLEKILE